jgi:hypothetical protein
VSAAGAQQYVLMTLRRHIGRANGVNGRNLVREVNAQASFVLGTGVIVVTERDLRHVVVELRLQGHHVCAHPSSGYFLAASVDELREATRFLKDRALSSLQQVAAMERVSLPDLFGQLHLPT